MVDEPSNPHSGSCSRVGKEANSLICVLPRRFGTGVYPSSQIYSSLYLVIELSHELMMRMGARSSAPTDVPGHHRPLRYQAIKVPAAAARHRSPWRRGVAVPAAMQIHGCG